MKCTDEWISIRYSLTKRYARLYMLCMTGKYMYVYLYKQFSFSFSSQWPFPWSLIVVCFVAPGENCKWTIYRFVLLSNLQFRRVVRNSVAQLAASIARFELAEQNWPEVLQFIQEGSSSPHPQQREVRQYSVTFHPPPPQIKLILYYCKPWWLWTDFHYFDKYLHNDECNSRFHMGISKYHVRASHIILYTQLYLIVCPKSPRFSGWLWTHQHIHGFPK